MKAYSGINSDTFLKGYRNNHFDKRNLTFMQRYESIYYYVPFLDIDIASYKIISTNYCGKRAKELSEKHGGHPIVFSSTLETRMNSVMPKEKRGKTSNKYFQVNPSVFKVDDIYLVQHQIKPLWLLLKKVSLEELKDYDKVDCVPGSLYLHPEINK